jgi:hypothetical protein
MSLFKGEWSMIGYRTALGLFLLIFLAGGFIWTERQIKLKLGKIVMYVLIIGGLLMALDFIFH